jgi:phosphate transport system protein
MAQDTRHFAEELAALKQRLLVMGGLAEDRVQTAMRALIARDHNTIAHVIHGDEAVNRLHLEIDDRCFKLLALHQPMAGDLRAVVSIVKINSDLERVGDLAVNLAEAAQRYIEHAPVKPLIDLPRMSEVAQRMLHDALDAFISRNVEIAQRVLTEDDFLDALKNQVFRELLSYMLSDPRKIEPGIELILMSRHLERVGDHATNIAEDVIFIVEGRDVRHRTLAP